MIVKHQLLWQRVRAAMPLTFLAALLVYAIWPWLFPQRSSPQTIVFYGFSILVEVMNKGIFPAFREKWMAETGEEVEFISSFAGSGTIRNQVIMGVPAQVVLLSLELDAFKLEEAGVVATQAWRRLPYQGVVNRTPFVILVRPGNPLQIRDFASLAKPGVEVVHPDPLTSGGANWAIVAEYGAGRREENDPAGGKKLLAGIWRNVAAQAASARAARTQFENGFGDALITYEQELIYDRRQGKLTGEIIYPPRTIRSEHTMVIIPRNIAPSEKKVVTAFVDFLWSEEAQRIFVEHGFRSVSEALNAANPDFGTISDLFSIEDFGGWKAAHKNIVEEIWKGGVLKEAGK